MSADLRLGAGWRALMIVLLSVLMALAMFQPASARWRYEDPKCFGGNRPSMDEPDELFDWYDECITDEEEPPGGGGGGGEPPLCRIGERLHVIAADGTHYLWICKAEGVYEITVEEHRGRPGMKAGQEVFPRVVGIAVRKNGYFVSVATPKGVVRQKVAVRQVKLGYLVRAFVHRVRLPRERVQEIQPAFWAGLPRPGLKVGQ